MRQLAEAKSQLIFHIDEFVDVRLIYAAYFQQSVDCSNYYAIRHRN